VPIVEKVGPDYFVPAYTEPPEKRPGPLTALLKGRRDLLSVWPKEVFEYDAFSFRILGRQIFVANSPEAVKHVMVTNHVNYERKSPQMRRALEPLLGDGLFVSDGDTWKFRRRVVAPIIHRRRLPLFAPIMVEAAAEVAERWSKLDPDSDLDMLPEMAALTAEIISRSVFGNELGRSAADEVIAGFSDYQALVDQVNIGYFLGFDDGWPQLPRPGLRKAARRVQSVVDDIISYHLDGKGDSNSMISMLLDARDDATGQTLTRRGIRNEAATIFMAGHETTAATLTWAWYLLAHARWAEESLHAELDDVLGSRLPTLDDLPRLRYTRAVIEETLRLYPPVPLLARQTRHDDVVVGHKVRRSSVAMVVPWILHRREAYWENPHHFMPGRFLQGKLPDLNAYVPLATVPRIGTGASFGLAESVLCLAVIAKGFRVRLKPGYKVVPQCRLTVRPRGGLPMRISKRTHSREQSLH
jgi:cytochrome P450